MAEREETKMNDGQDERHSAEAVEQPEKIRKLLAQREAWERTAREAQAKAAAFDAQLQLAFDALLWISEAPNREERLTAVALADYARRALGPLEVLSASTTR
jgi:hypothetical protein